jgi:hypothetical protein
MKAKSIVKLSLTVIIIAILAYITAFGLTIGKFSIPKAELRFKKEYGASLEIANNR